MGGSTAVGYRKKCCFESKEFLVGDAASSIYEGTLYRIYGTDFTRIGDAHLGMALVSKSC